MSYKIKESIENIELCLKSVEDVRLSADFYDTIYIGKHLDRYSVIHSGIKSFLYVLKDESQRCLDFQNTIGRIKGLKKASPFLNCSHHQRELSAINNLHILSYYDIIFIEQPSEESLCEFIKNYTLFNRSEFSESFTKLNTITKELFWLLNSPITISNFSLSLIYLVENDARINFDYKNIVTTGQMCCEASLRDFRNLISNQIAALWLLFFKACPSVEFTTQLIDNLKSKRQNPLEDVHEELLCNAFDTFLEATSIDLRELTATHDMESGCKSVTIKKLLSLRAKRSEKLITLQTISPLSNALKDDGYVVGDEIVENRAIIQDKKSRLFGYCDTFGNIITPAIYKECSNFYEDVAVVQKQDNTYIAIDNENNILCHNGESFDSLDWMGTVNRFIGVTNGEYNLYNSSMELLTRRSYSWMGEFSNSRAVVEDSSTSLLGYIDLDGTEITPLIYTEALSFHNHCGKVVFNNKRYILTMEGDFIEGDL